MGHVLQIAVVAGGYSGEAEVSRKSAATVMDHIDPTRYRATLVHIDRDGWWAEVDGRRMEVDRADFSVPEAGLRFDGVFVMVHGSPGEDGRLQAYFELIGMPHTTGDARSMALTFHKGWTNDLLRARGVPVARAVALGPESVWTAEELVAELGLPCFVKPTESGSSIGVSRVDRAEDLARAVAEAMAAERPGVVVEAMLVGREFTVGVIPGADGRPCALPITEIRTDRPFFDFQAKYLGASEEITPADLPPARAAALHALALRTYALTECRGMARVDLIDSETDGPHVIEVNTVPGFSPASILPQQAAAAGLTTTELLTRVLAATVERR